MNDKFLVMTNERLSALFDGVIAIAITLLVLELKVPEVQGNAELLLHDALRAQIPEIVAWFISFVMIARIWQEQHIIWVYISGCDRWSIILTFFLLAACSLIPFGSNLVGKYPDSPFVVLIFSVLMVVNGLLVAALAAYVIHNDHLHRERGQVMILKNRVIYLAPVIPAIGALAVFLAYEEHPLIGVSMWLIEPLALFVYHQVKGNVEI